MTEMAMALSLVSASFDTFRMSKRLRGHFSKKLSCAERERFGWERRGSDKRIHRRKKPRKIQPAPIKMYDSGQCLRLGFGLEGVLSRA